MLWRIDDDDEEEDVSNVISCSLLSALILKFCMYIFVLGLLFLDFVKRKVKESVAIGLERGLLDYKQIYVLPYGTNMVSHNQYGDPIVGCRRKFTHYSVHNV